MRHVPIPGGQATFRDLTELRGRDRNLINAAAMAATSALTKLPDKPEQQEGESNEEYVARLGKEVEKLDLSWQEALKLIEMRQAVIVGSLAEWTLELPLPTMETIGDLPGELYDALETAVGGDVLAKAMGGTNFEPGDPRSPEFEQSPTTPSSSFAGRSEGEGESQTPSQQPDIEASVTAGSFQG